MESDCYRGPDEPHPGLDHSTESSLPPIPVLRRERATKMISRNAGSFRTWTPNPTAGGFNAAGAWESAAPRAGIPLLIPDLFPGSEGRFLPLTGLPHFAPKVKRVIYLSSQRGPLSNLRTFRLQTPPNEHVR